MKKILNKKGFVFSLDLILGITIVVSIFFISLFYVSQAREDSISSYQLELIGADIVQILEKDLVFYSLDQETIELEMEKYIPSHYDMLIRIEGNFSAGNGTIEAGGELPEKQSIVSGRSAVLTEDGTYLKVTYFTWSMKQ